MNKNKKVDVSTALATYIQVDWNRFWFMVDLDNGHRSGKPWEGIGYVWVFKTKKEAMAHRSKQHKKKTNARLSLPVRVDFQQNRSKSNN